MIDPTSIVMHGNSIEMMLKALVAVIVIIFWPLLKK